MSCNPVLVEVTRGDKVESQHRGAFCVVDQFGRILERSGDIDQLVFPRSTVKLAQALPIVELALHRQFRLGAQHLAVICSSHSGEKMHFKKVKQIIEACGLSEEDLCCGVHSSIDETIAFQNARDGILTGPLHHNCSGKHAGMLSLCVHNKWPTQGYNNYHHPLQAKIREVLSAVFSFEHSRKNMGTDSCSVPTYQVPLRALAIGFSRLSSGTGIETSRHQAAKLLFESCTSQAWYTAGSNRLDTKIMQSMQGKIYSKVGSEGTAVAAILHEGIGISIKIDDGSVRAVRILLKAILSRTLKSMTNETVPEILADCEPIYGNDGENVGSIKARLPDFNRSCTI